MRVVVVVGMAVIMVLRVVVAVAMTACRVRGHVGRTLAVFLEVMLAQQILAVVIAVGCAHHRVDVVLGRGVVAQPDPAVVIELDHQQRAVDAVIERIVIAVTADTEPEDMAACLASGMNAFVSKPLTPAALLDALSRTLDAAAQDAEAAA